MTNKSFDALDAQSLATDETTVTDPSGNSQLRFVGLGQSNEVEDVDNINQDGFLDAGVLLEAVDSDSLGTIRLVLGQNVYLGMQADNPNTAEGPQTSEMLKSSAAQTILENDYQDRSTVLESKNGGGVALRCDDGTGTETNRLTVEGDVNSRQAVFNNLDRIRTSANLKLHDPDNSPVGGSVANIFPDASNNELQFTSGGTFAFKPSFGTELSIGSDRVKIGSSGTVGNMPPQDVRNVSSPQRGDVAYHDGSGNAGEGVAYYDGANWNVLDGGTQP